MTLLCPLQSQPLFHLTIVAIVICCMFAMGSHTMFGDAVPALSSYSLALQDAAFAVRGLGAVLSLCFTSTCKL